MNKSFNLLFYVKRSKTNAEGLAPVYLRITIDFNDASADSGPKIFNFVVSIRLANKYYLLSSITS